MSLWRFLFCRCNYFIFFCFDLIRPHTFGWGDSCVLGPSMMNVLVVFNSVFCPLSAPSPLL
jgi:hypothetical protein